MPVRKLFLTISFLLSVNTIIAQNDVIRLRTCSNDDIKRQADSLKQLLTDSGGFEMIKEAMVAMESEYEMPVIVPLEGGRRYQVVFIGDINSKLYEVRMYDYSENQVAYEKNKRGDTDANIINYPYTPPTSQFHMIKPLQVNNKQKKNLCGYILLLRKKQG